MYKTRKGSTMEKKVKFTDNPNFAKTVYGIVIATLCITAIIIGIVAANHRQQDELPSTPPANEGTADGSGETPDEAPEENGDSTAPKKLSLISPVSGRVFEDHDLSTPVFSTTLEEWRVHCGIDISTNENAPVFAAADGTVSAVYSHPLLGYSIEITHDEGVKTIYRNLASDNDLVKVGDTVALGDRIGTVGDTSISEIAEETHLHFEVTRNDKCIDPLSLISEASKEASLTFDAD